MQYNNVLMSSYLNSHVSCLHNSKSTSALIAVIAHLLTRVPELGGDGPHTFQKVPHTFGYEVIKLKIS